MQSFVLSLETLFIYDVPNFIICVITVLSLSNWLSIPKSYTFLLLLHCFVPFMLNDVLFPASYMGDQFRYTAAVQEIRASFQTTELGNTANASWLLAFIPLPFVETVSSLGFFNKFIFILTFVFLYQKKLLTTFSAYFLLLYPSVVLYTSLSLRDNLIVIFMMLICYFATKRNVAFILLFLTLLVFIKFQNFLLMVPVLFFALLGVNKKGMSPRIGFVLLALGAVALVLSFPIVGPLINLYRFAMYREDGGQNINEVPSIDTISDFIFIGLTSGLYFFAKPFPWEASKALQLIQSVENIVIMYLVVKLTVQAWKSNVRQLMFWLVLFIASLSVYGLVVFNYGTAARYRFPFIVIYVLFVCYSCKIENVLNFSKRNVEVKEV